MATITRGHSFAVNDVVTAFTLNKLVSGAIISGLTASEFAGSDGIINVGTAPTDTMQDGALAAIYEAPFTSSTPSFVEYNYLLKMREGLVALFKPLGLESRRFFHDDSPNVPGTAFTFQVTGQGATLIASRGYTDQTDPRHLFLGAGNATANSTVSNHMIRMTLKGVATTRISVSGTGNTQKRRYFAVDNNSGTGAWASSTATNSDKTAGMALNIQTAGDTRVVSWLFGAPLYRA